MTGFCCVFSQRFRFLAISFRPEFFAKRLVVLRPIGVENWICRELLNRFGEVVNRLGMFSKQRMTNAATIQCASALVVGMSVYCLRIIFDRFAILADFPARIAAI